jgi:hypothetical protein
MLRTWWAHTEDWINGHVSTLGIAVAMCGLLWRLFYSSGYYLNPDEALHYTAATHDWHGWVGFYRNATLVLHPPLFIPVLQGILLFGRSEWLLRLVPAVAGALFPGFIMLWMRRFTSNAAALCAQLLLTFSPSLINLGMEVRAYTLAFLFLSICLIFLEESLDQKSVRYMILFHTFLYLAILTEYCVAWFVASLGVYALLRLRRSPAAGGLLATWALGEAGALSIYLFLYFTHIVKSSHTGLEGMYSTWLREAFPRSREYLVVFALRGTLRQFIYMFQIRWLAWIAAIAFPIGLYRLWRDKSPIHAILLVLPFCVACLGAVFYLFPYGATRHTAILGIPIAAGLGIVVASVTRDRTLPILILGLPVIFLWNALSMEPSLSIPRHRRHLSAMHDAINFLSGSVPEGSVIVTDAGTDLMLGYYLGCPDYYYFDSRESSWIHPCRRLRFVVAPTYAFSGQTELRETLMHVKVKYQLKEPVWVAAGGFDITVGNPASDSKSFGKTIAIFKDTDLSNAPTVSQRDG